MTFLNIGIADILDIFMVAFLLYQLYNLIKGTAAMRIFIGVAALYLTWLLVRAVNMQLISSILGHVMGVGVIALLIVFQQEVRKFFLFVSNHYLARFEYALGKIGLLFSKEQSHPDYPCLAETSFTLSKTYTGALIVIKKESDLLSIIESGEKLNARLSRSLIETIFQKRSPMHDGAIIINDDTIEAAKCVLPLSDKHNLPASFGMRHRAAMGLSEQSDALIIVVSEETGQVRLFYKGRYRNIKNPEDLKENLQRKFAAK